MRSILVAVVFVASGMAALGAEVARLPTVMPFFVGAGLYGGPFAGGALDRSASSRCIDPSCSWSAGLAGYDRRWLRAYLDRLPRAEQGGGFFAPDAIVLVPPTAFTMTGGNQRRTGVHGGVPQPSTMPLGLPRLEPTKEKNGGVSLSFETEENRKPFQPPRMPSGLPR